MHSSTARPMVECVLQGVAALDLLGDYVFDIGDLRKGIHRPAGLRIPSLQLQPSGVEYQAQVHRVCHVLVHPDQLVLIQRIIHERMTQHGHGAAARLMVLHGGDVVLHRVQDRGDGGVDPAVHLFVDDLGEPLDLLHGHPRTLGGDENGLHSVGDDVVDVIPDAVLVQVLSASTCSSGQTLNGTSRYMVQKEHLL